MASRNQKKTESENKVSAQQVDTELQEWQNVASTTNSSATSTETRLLDDALGLEITAVEVPAPKLDRKVLNTLVDAINAHYNCNSTGIAYAGICATLQAGGTNSNKRSNVKITLNNVKFESKKINELIRQITKLSPRQLARFIANDIFMVSKKFNITGNAFVYIQRFHSTLLTELPGSDERYWASDFQLDNPNCDGNVKKALQARYADKFGAKKRK